MAQVCISITRYDEADTLIVKCLTAALNQTGVSGEVLFLDQNVDSVIDDRQFGNTALSLRVNRGHLQGLSEARNIALKKSPADLVLFLDADAIANPDWAMHLAVALSQPKVAVAGSRILPGWPGRAPILAKATAILDQYSMLDLGRQNRTVGKIVGAGFGVDRNKLASNFAFDTSLGRRGGKLFGGEETDFCNRARESGQQIVYCGKAVVTHLVDPDRLTLSWIMRRMFYAGAGRSAQGGGPSPSHKLNFWDWLFMPLYLPPYVAGWLYAKFRSGG